MFRYIYHASNNKRRARKALRVTAPMTIMMSGSPKTKKVKSANAPLSVLTRALVIAGRQTMKANKTPDISRQTNCPVRLVGWLLVKLVRLRDCQRALWVVSGNSKTSHMAAPI